MHAELAEVGVLLQAPYRVDRFQVDLAHPALLTPLLVVESLHPLLDPLPESALDGGFAALEVARYGLRAPPSEWSSTIAIRRSVGFGIAW